MIDPKVTACYILLLKGGKTSKINAEYSKEIMSAANSLKKYDDYGFNMLTVEPVAKLLVDQLINLSRVKYEFIPFLTQAIKRYGE